MPINLQELRTAVQNYLDTKVTVSISSLLPGSGASIQRNEGFKFRITATNANAANGGIALRNVRYHVWVDDQTIGKLIVPNSPLKARSGCLIGDPELAPGTQVISMYIFPTGPVLPDEKSYLSPGESDTLELEGKAGNKVGGGTTNIRFRILAEPDMDYLFPKNEDSPTASRTLQVID